MVGSDRDKNERPYRTSQSLDYDYSMYIAQLIKFTANNDIFGILNTVKNILPTIRELYNHRFDCFDSFKILLLIREIKNEKVKLDMTFTLQGEDDNTSYLDDYTPIIFSKSDRYSFSRIISNSIFHIFSFEDIPTVAKLYYADDLIRTLLLAAQKRGLINEEASKIIESHFAQDVYMHKMAELYNKRIDLLDSVSSAARALMINPPTELIEQKEAWINSVYQEICNFGMNTSYKGSKTKTCAKFRRIGTLIGNKENPFSQKESEMKNIIEYALAICKLLAIGTTDRKGIRKDVELKLENFRKAYISLAGCIKCNPERHATSLIDGQFYSVGINNHYKKLEIRTTHPLLPF